jgi:hypothetical protein
MSAKEVRADPVQVTRLADQMLRTSQAIGDVWRRAQGTLAVPAAAFGDSAGGPGTQVSHSATTDDADIAIGRLVAVLEGDMDKLYRIAFAYKKADDDAARKFRQQHPNLVP